MTDLSIDVYRQIIRHVVPDVTEDEINAIIREYPDESPLCREWTVSTIRRRGFSEMDAQGIYVTSTLRVMESDDPLRLAVRLENSFCEQSHSDEEIMDSYATNYMGFVSALRESEVSTNSELCEWLRANAVL